MITSAPFFRREAFFLRGADAPTHRRHKGSLSQSTPTRAGPLGAVGVMSTWKSARRRLDRRRRGILLSVNVWSSVVAPVYVLTVYLRLP
jgi:hypothetical protein